MQIKDNQHEKKIKHNAILIPQNKNIKWNVNHMKVLGYLITNAISSGIFVVLFIGLFLNLILKHPFISIHSSSTYSGLTISLCINAIISFFLWRDIHLLRIKSPKALPFIQRRSLRFTSYTILLFGILVGLLLISHIFKFQVWLDILPYPTMFTACISSISTSHLLQQNQNIWNQYTLYFHMLINSIMAGAVTFIVANNYLKIGITLSYFGGWILYFSLVISLLSHLLLIQFIPITENKTELIHAITKGKFKYLFWIGGVLLGNILPLILILTTRSLFIHTIASILILIGILIIDYLWLILPTYFTFRK